MKRLSQSQLHRLFIEASREHIVKHSQIENKPLEIDFVLPYPKIRLYIFNATHPPGGRTLGEHKIQIIVPNQKRGTRGNFDQSAHRIPLLAGYESEHNVFIFWDAGMYVDFSYSRNVQVKAETIYAAYTGKIAEQERYTRTTIKEIVVAVRSDLLMEGLQQRLKRTTERALGQYQ